MVWISFISLLLFLQSTFYINKIILKPPLGQNRWPPFELPVDQLSLLQDLDAEYAARMARVKRAEDKLWEQEQALKAMERPVKALYRTAHYT